MARVDVTNLQTFDSNIGDIELSLKTKEGEWVPMRWLDSSGSKTLFFSNLKEGLQIQVDNLRDVLIKSPLKSKECARDPLIENHRLPLR